MSSGENIAFPYQEKILRLPSMTRNFGTLHKQHQQVDDDDAIRSLTHSRRT